MKKLICAALAALSLAGCATVGTPANATAQQKMIADAQVLAGIVNDIKAKCAPEFAPLAPVVLAALQIAATPQDVLSDIMAVVQASPDLYKDGQGIACVIQTVVNDLKTAAPKKGTTAYLQLEMGQQVLLALGPDAVAASCVASR